MGGHIETIADIIGRITALTMPLTLDNYAALPADERAEVRDVLGDDCPLLGARRLEDGLVGLAAQIGTFSDGYDVVTTLSQCLGDRRRRHLVEQQLQARSSSCSLRHAASAAAASSSTRWLHSLISSR